MGSGQAAAAQTPDRYIVVLKAGVPASAVANDHAVVPEFVYSHALNGFSAVVPAGRLNGLQRDPRVAFVEADQPVQLFAQTIPTGIQRIFANTNGAIDIDGSDDWRVDVDVAVIDTGIDLDHPDLNVVASTNCSGGGPFKQSCGSGGNDGNGHGTHVAGTIGAIDNNIGVVGVAPGARLWAVKVLSDSGSGYNSWVIAGIDYVTANAASIEVANMSLGGGNSTALCTAVNNSVAAGVVHVVAAGNSDANASTSSPANCADVITVSALADFDGKSGGLITNTSTYCRNDQDDTLADFSNWGSTIEVTAPGVCILSTWAGGGYATISGTSMASPHVAGAAALLASNGAGPASILSTLQQEGNLNWTDDSGDPIQERLLDVSNTSVFNPTLVAGSGGGGSNTAPTANDVSATTDEDTAVAITLSGSDAETCELEFIVTGPSNGTLSGITNNTCGSGSPNTDTASVTYTPNAGYTGSDSFTYKANDGTLDSNTATVSITVTDTSTTMHVGDLDGSSTSQGSSGNWRAIVTIAIHDSSNNPVAGATVSGTFTWNGSLTSVSCLTDTSGQCSVSKSGIKVQTGSVTLTVTGVSGPLTYDATANHDPDGGTGTSIVVAKP